MALVQMGGLTGSLLLTIIIVPIMYVVVDIWKASFACRKKRIHPREAIFPAIYPYQTGNEQRIIEILFKSIFITSFFHFVIK
jgi:multisubunit Na+/H+ antiporter MnhE subunit